MLANRLLQGNTSQCNTEGGIQTVYCVKDNEGRQKVTLHFDLRPDGLIWRTLLHKEVFFVCAGKEPASRQKEEECCVKEYL